MEANNDDRLIKIVRNTEKRKTYGIISYIDGGSTKEIDQEHQDGLEAMKMHGDYFKQQAELVNVELTKSQEWLNQSHLRFETESLICAAQEQALHTKYMRSKIWGCNSDSKCRLCGEQNETVHHIVSGCKMLTGTKYKYRHDQILKYLHWWILKDLGITVTENWTNHKPEATEEINGVIVMWDLDIETDKNVQYNRPDIVIHDTKNRTCQLIDVSVPICRNVVSKTAEKIVKYRNLEIEIQKCWNLTKVSTVPIIIGALGTVCQDIMTYIKAISKNIEFSVIQKTALLGTAHILRSFLTPIPSNPLTIKSCGEK